MLKIIHNTIIVKLSIKFDTLFFMVCKAYGIFLSSESLVTIVTTKCSEPQAVDRGIMGEESGVANLSSIRIET